MKILFLGHLDEGQTTLMRMRALRRLGHEVVGIDTIRPWLEASWGQRQLQRRLQKGPIVESINSSVLAAARSFKPDLIWAEKQEFLKASTLEDLRRLGPRLLHFTPDPYFTLDWKRTRVMDQALPLFDALVYCKAYERADYQATGQLAQYMPLGYCDQVHRPLPTDEPSWSCSVGFLGGWEPRREHMLRAIAERTNLKIRGAAWEFLVDGKWSLRRHVVLSQLAGVEPFRIHRDQLLAEALQGGEVYADDYAKALSGARIGLGFLRKVCPDQHTTRTFEIPACGSMLLADRTTEHQELFEEGKEAEFFETSEELLDKIDFYGKNETERKNIVQRGLIRCQTSRYAYIHRIAETVSSLRTPLGLPS